MTAYYMGNCLKGIVDDYCKLIGEESILTLDDEISNFLCQIL